MVRAKLLLSLIASFLVSCATVKIKTSKISYQDFNKLTLNVQNGSINPKHFKSNGPYKVKSVKNYLISVSPTLGIASDLYLPSHKQKTPLVIFSHGNKFYKEVHSIQAKHLASWGFAALTLQMPNRNQWIKNGKRIAELTKVIHKVPSIISANVAPESIILVGHSFGGSAITVAAGNEAPVAGLILLDPAVVSNSVIPNMRKVQVPTLLLGADPKVFRSRRRKLFFQKIPSTMAEISVKGSTHNDAQIPSIEKILYGFNLVTTPKKQLTFLKYITLGAFSILEKNPLNLAWAAILRDKERGVLNFARKKSKNSFNMTNKLKISKYPKTRLDHRHKVPAPKSKISF